MRTPLAADAGGVVHRTAAAGVPDVIHITTRTITIYNDAVKHRT